MYTKLCKSRIDPVNEVLVAYGAREALYCCIHGIVEFGDEVIIIEPAIDSITSMVRSSGGKPVFVPIRPKGDASNSANWVLDDNELRESFNKRTKAIIIHTPNSPTGKVFAEAELQIIATLCHKWDVVCISDESYEWFVIPPNKHARICTLPSMWERTLTVGSAGKTFFTTGWKTGWAYGPIHLMRNVFFVHQNCIRTHCTPIQEAIARAIEGNLDKMGTKQCFFANGPEVLKNKLDIMIDVFQKVNLKSVKPQGSFYFMADWTGTAHRCDLDDEKDEYLDYKFTKWMIKNAGIEFIPISAFLSQKNKSLGENFFRTCIMKVCIIFFCINFSMLFYLSGFLFGNAYIFAIALKYYHLK